MPNDLQPAAKGPLKNRPPATKKGPAKQLPLDPQDARKSALAILTRIQKGEETLDAVMAYADSQTVTMSAKDRSLTRAIVFGVLRWRRRLDTVIAHFSKVKLGRIDPVILTCLRIGLYQILYLDRVPVSAAVNTTVQLAKAHAPTWVAGYVNGVLRAATRSKAPFSEYAPAEGVQRIAVEKSFPNWLIRRWLDRFGEAETSALCDAVNTIPNLTLRVNTLAGSCSDIRESLQPDIKEITATRFSPVGLHIGGLTRPIDQIPAFKSGLFQVQDEAAQLVTLLLDPQPGETVLDACAGLGGKTGHIAQQMKNQGLVTAADHHPGKLRNLQQEMKRLGVTCVQTYAVDWNNSNSKSDLPQFDRILLDAPCSGIGVIRRNPDIKWRPEKSDLKRFAARQMDFLNRLAPLLKPGGILVYAVCSFEIEENELVINGFLKNHSEFDKENIGSNDPVEIASLGCSDGFLRTLPHRHPMDGFFAARIRRKR